MARRPAQLAAELNRHRDAFKAFLTARVGSAAEAEDILQGGLLKALQRADELQDEAKLTAWFYQLLRNALVDHYRARGAGMRSWAKPLPPSARISSPPRRVGRPRCAAAWAASWTR